VQSNPSVIIQNQTIQPVIIFSEEAHIINTFTEGFSLRIYKDYTWQRRTLSIHVDWPVKQASDMKLQQYNSHHNS